MARASGGPEVKVSVDDWNELAQRYNDLLEKVNAFDEALDELDETLTERVNRIEQQLADGLRRLEALAKAVKGVK